MPIVKSVTILTNGQAFLDVKNDKIDINNKKITEIKGNDDKVESVVFEDKTSMDISGIFIAEGVATSVDFAKKLGIITENNFIKVDNNMKTNANRSICMWRLHRRIAANIESGV
jgi:thioredoxin reductase (NADPH)